ncbi:response regulator [Segetibacter koreensis]|uniref:response regulator n=1 Tax=Segetibacter koreensis TaxID=398037 RepID=UPI0003731FEC|nr:response regulator [Segetibacter koreensis]
MVINLSQPVKAYFTDDDLDDYQLFLEAVSKVSKNIELVSFSNCETLLEMLKQNTPQILFIDIHLGNTTGIECLRIIQTLPHLSAVPKVIMSTYASRLQIDDCEQMGCKYYLQKPSSFVEIINEMQKIFEKDWECN